jgi:hypothetical protein
MEPSPLNNLNPSPATTTTHDHIYTTLLGVCAFFVLFGIVILAWIRSLPTTPSESRSAMMLPILVEGLFLAAMTVVLLIRILFPANRRWPTIGLNIILVLMFPFGTALAIYGFWKVDKSMTGNST